MNSREHSQILRSTNIHSLGHNCRDRCTYLGIALTVSANPPDRECAVWHKSSAVPTTVPTVQVSMTLYSTVGTVGILIRDSAYPSLPSG